MLVEKNITFSPRAILTHEMLTTLQEFPKSALSLRYAEFGDGIVEGFHFKKVNDEIFVTAGIIKFCGKFYLSDSGDFNLTKFLRENKPKPRSNTYCLALVPQNTVTIGGVQNTRLKLEIVEGENSAPLNLGNFYDEGNFNLPNVNVSAENFFVEFTGNSDNLKIAQLPYSCAGGTTFHPYIFQAIKNILLAKKNKTSADFLLLMQIYQNQFVPLEVLKTYIEANGVAVNFDLDRILILKNLPAAFKAVPQQVTSFTQEKKAVERKSPAQYESLIIYD